MSLFLVPDGPAAFPRTCGGDLKHPRNKGLLAGTVRKRIIRTYQLWEETVWKFGIFLKICGKNTI